MTVYFIWSFDMVGLSPALLGSTFLVLAIGQLFPQTVLLKENQRIHTIDRDLRRNCGWLSFELCSISSLHDFHRNSYQRIFFPPANSFVDRLFPTSSDHIGIFLLEQRAGGDTSSPSFALYL